MLMRIKVAIEYIKSCNSIISAIEKLVSEALKIQKINNNQSR